MSGSTTESTHIEVKDIHAGLSPARVVRIEHVESVDDVQRALARARDESLAVSIAGGHHAMGGQQFCDGGVLLDMRGMSRVEAFDREAGLVTAEAGIRWPELVAYLRTEQAGEPEAWGIRQKQTGADRLTLGGTLSANGHGRGLTMQPIVADVEAFELVDAAGELHRCSRSEHAELFSLAIGGYGLFGVICSVTLRLARRRQIERTVEVMSIGDVAAAFQQRIADGYAYGDFQYSIDEGSPDFLQRGVFSCYRPVDAERPVPDDQKALSKQEWAQLLYLAHTDKSKVFDLYAGHYLATSGQLYDSDTHQMADYTDGYHHQLDLAVEASTPATEMITEVYVPRDRLADFMAEAARDLRERGSNVIYGTVRLIEADTETFLAWAREPFACIIFNLHVVHDEPHLAAAREDFRHLIDLAMGRGGSYFLTYHRWARRDQVERCYPKLREFLARKLEHDPGELLQSDWYRHYRAMFASGAAAKEE
jgi:FAD/FMN-containing dehydrogenase